MRVLLLALFDDSAMHGYELIRKIKGISRGAYAPSPGMIYPVLAEMAEDGLLAKHSEEAGRKTYVIMPDGRAAAQGSKDQMADISARLENLALVESSFRAPLRRAVANLELVLANLPADAGDELIDRIVTIIDSASRTIERLD